MTFAVSPKVFSYPWREDPGVTEELRQRETNPDIWVYLASYFDTRSRLLPIRDALTRSGLVITSRWLDEPHQATGAATLNEAVAASTTFKHSDLMEYAERDYNDIYDSDVLVLDTLDITPRGGREVEFGLALAWYKPCYVVGPERNVFHKMAFGRWDTWDEALEKLPVLLKNGDHLG